MTTADDVEIKRGDRIGWAFTSDVGLIPYSFSDKGRGYFTRLNQPLAIGQKVKFDGPHLAAVFSIAVYVKGGRMLSLLNLYNLT